MPYVLLPPCVLQLVFAVVSPGAVLPNLVAGAIAEAGAQQAGDLMQVRVVCVYPVCMRACVKVDCEDKGYSPEAGCTDCFPSSATQHTTA